ncbi:O-antigen ligase family protein [Viscerimonas tarda]
MLSPNSCFSKKEKIAFFLFFLTCFVSLLTSSIYIDNTHLGVYGYVFISLILWGYILLFCFKNDKKIDFNRTTICYAIFIIYILIINVDNVNFNILKREKFIVLAFSFIHFVALFSYFNRNLEKIVSIIAIFNSIFLFSAVFQSCYFYLQMIGLLGNTHPYFEMGGTLGNPNILANYLSLCVVFSVSYILFLIKSIQKKDNPKVRKKITLIALGVLIILPVILLCKCRTAWIALFMGGLASLIFNYPAFWKSKKGIVLSVFLIISGIFFVGQLYSFKQQSADSRLSIWTGMTEMIKEKPVTGYGYDSFERLYNLKQTEYFDQLPASDKNYLEGRYVEVAYNDYLEICFESGIIGLILFLSIFVFAVYPLLRSRGKNNPNPYAIVAVPVLLAWLVTGLFNYNLIAPFNMLFLSFALSLIGLTRPVYTFNLRKIAVLCLFVLVLFVFVKAYNMSKTETTLNEQVKSGKEFHGNYEDLNRQYSTLEKTGKNLYSYALFLQRCGFKDKSIEKLEEAKNLSSNYNIYIALGRMYGETGNLDAAIQNYRIASGMVPYLLIPRYELTLLLDKAGDKAAALAEAQLIGEIPIKVASKKADNIKRLAKMYVEKAGHGSDEDHDHEHEHPHPNHNRNLKGVNPNLGLHKKHVHNAFCNHH